ncbi:hypothetical protein MJO28_011344, partial [Puccinia striiformis f. sp. tritici]
MGLLVSDAHYNQCLRKAPPSVSQALFKKFSCHLSDNLKYRLRTSFRVLILDLAIRLAHGADAAQLYVDGPGGCGKTFLMNVISHYMKAMDIPLLTVLSSGVASLMLVDSSTAHSRFTIPITLEANTMCNWNCRAPKWLLSIGNGTGQAEFTEDRVLKFGSVFINPSDALVCHKVISTSVSINAMATNQESGNADEAVTEEVLHTFKISGFPNSLLKLKVGIPIILLRNLDLNNGLSNRTQLLILDIQEQ